MIPYFFRSLLEGTFDFLVKLQKVLLTMLELPAG